MKPNQEQEQALIELKRQLEEICALDKIDRQTIRDLQDRLQQLEAEESCEPPKSNARNWGQRGNSV